MEDYVELNNMATENKQAEKKYMEKRMVPQHEHMPDYPQNKMVEEAQESFVKFSFVFPSRDRIPLLTKMLESLLKNTENLDEIEVHIAVDNDDTATFDFLCASGYPFIRVHKVPRSLNFSRDYYNYLAKHTTGKWIITANDDCVMETPGWDTKAYAVLKDRPGVVYGWIADGIDGFRARGHGNYCCFPLQGRAGYEALGYIFPVRVPTWGADIWAKNLYDQVGSVVEIPITLRHYCHHNKTREQDHISKRIANNQVPFDMRPTYDEINKLLGALRKEKVTA